MQPNDTAPLPDTKTCTKCGETKPLDDFPFHQKRGSWDNSCRPCTRASDRAWYVRNQQYKIEYARQRRTQHPELARQAYRNWYAKPGNLARRVANNRIWQTAHADRVRYGNAARLAVGRAIKSGRLIRPSTCEACGVADVVIEGAHSNYANPLDVRWLCRPCHRRWDAADPKTKH